MREQDGCLTHYRCAHIVVFTLLHTTVEKSCVSCADVGFNASVTIEELGSPDKIIQGFAPELYGSPLSVSVSSCRCVFC